MIRTHYAGASYIDAWPSGECVRLYIGSRLETHLGSVAFPPGETFGLMFLHCTPVGGYKFEGLAHDSGILYERVGVEWRATTPITGRCIYDLTGAIRDTLPAGYQYLDEATDTPIARTITYGPKNGLSEWCMVADLQIGQVHDSLGPPDIALWDGRVHRLIASGLGYFINAHCIGEDTAISWAGDGYAMTLRATMAELRMLPVLQPKPPEPEPTPPGPDPEPTPPDPTPFPPPDPTPAHGFYIPPTYRIDGNMLSEKGGIIGAGGKYGRMGPIGSSPVGGWRLLIFDGNTDQGDYEFTLTETTPGRGVAQDTATGSYAGQDIAVGDLTQCAYGKPSAPGAYETPYLFGPVAGVRFFWIPFNADDIVKVPFGGSILTWVPRKA